MNQPPRQEYRFLIDTSPAVQYLLLVGVEATIVVGAAIEALLTGELVVRHALPALMSAWPTGLSRLAHLLLWPLTRPLGLAPAAAPVLTIVLAMLVYLLLTISAVGAINLVVRRRLTVAIDPTSAPRRSAPVGGVQPGPAAPPPPPSSDR